MVCFSTDPAMEGTEWNEVPPLGSTQEELREQYVGWEPEVQALINVCSFSLL